MANKGNNKYTVLQGVYEKESPWKLTKPRGSSTNQRAEQLANNCHIPDLVQAFSEENGGLNQVLRRVKPPACMTVVYSSVFDKTRGAQITMVEKSVKSNSHEVTRIYNSRPSCMICETETEYLSMRSWYLPMNFFRKRTRRSFWKPWFINFLLRHRWRFTNSE